ncbi:nucleolar complex protein 3 homolog [Ctenocephalides felis]|nr:nucleolar complex protein 3 homolog [Ctenocephalides felis]
MLETKAEENKQAKQKQMTEITKVLFTIYFRILKRAPNSKVLSVALEGLSKFSHVINLELYSDLVDVLNSLMQPGDDDDDEKRVLNHRDQLMCVQTVFSVLSGQGECLNIDPLRFYTHLYRNLMHINAGRTNIDLETAVKTLCHVLIRRRKQLSQQRLLAF